MTVYFKAICFLFISFYVASCSFAVLASQKEQEKRILKAPLLHSARERTRSVQELSQRLFAIKTLRAHFLQLTIHAERGKTPPQHGALWVKRPNFFRWLVYKPYQLVVTNGRSVKIYDKELEQVTIQNLNQQIKMTPALLLSGDSHLLLKNFTVTGRKEKTGFFYKLTPKSSDTVFASLTLIFTPKGLLRRMIIVDAFGGKTFITFSNLVMNHTIANERFILDFPKGVDVIDARGH